MIGWQSLDLFFDVADMRPSATNHVVSDWRIVTDIAIFENSNFKDWQTVIFGEWFDDTPTVSVTTIFDGFNLYWVCLLYTSPSPRDATLSRMPSSA